MVAKIHVLYFSLATSVAIGLAAIIFIIVDKTTYCRTGDPKPNTAVSYENGTVVCFPGFVFADGLETHSITCDSPPKWNWNEIPDCIPVNEVVAWKCPVQSTETELTGEILIFQSDPSVAVRVQGELMGLRSSSIQAIDVEDTNKTCHITNEIGSLGVGNTVIDGNVFRIDETLFNPMMINETFQFSIRAIGSQHVKQPQRADLFDGVATFVLEQNKKTIGVFSASSSMQ